MSVIQAGNTTTTSLIYTGDTTGNLVFTTGGANTTALTLSNTQAATFAGTLTTASQGIAFASLPTGSILQVVNPGPFVSASTTTSTTLQLSNVTASITPKFSTSKILVLASCAIYIAENGQGQVYYYGRCSLARGSTQLIEARMNINTGSTAITDGGVNLPIMYLDSPATTSSTTYNIYISALNASFSIGINSNAPSTLTLMEIAA